MQLPAFISRAVAFFDKAEANLTAVDLAKTKITELESANAKALKDLGERDASIKDLQGKLSASQKDVADRDGKIQELEGKVTTEQGRANKTIAGQGLPVDQAPAHEPEKKAAAGAKNSFQEYERLRAADPRAAGAYWAKNAEAILNDRAEAAQE